MELWIRSQDKHNLVKANNLSISHDFDYKDNEHHYTIQEHEYSTELGYYETKERCLQILDEIQNILNPMLIFKNCECTKDVLDSIKEVGACIVHDNAKLEQINIYVFEMPEV